MKATVISLLAVFLSLGLASALEFNFDSPSSAKLNETLTVALSAATSDIYDVKIWVQDNGTKSTLSQIYNEGWKNPYYYLKSAFPDKKEFSIHVTNYSDSAQLCVRMRKSGTTAYSDKCAPLEISPSQQTHESSDDEENESSPEEVAAVNKTAKESPDFIPILEDQITTQTDNPPVEAGKIVLTSKVISNDDTFTTKNEKIRLYAVYSFTLFAIFIIILLVLKKF
jgi:hypothetical protein